MDYHLTYSHEDDIPVVAKNASDIDKTEIEILMDGASVAEALQVGLLSSTVCYTCMTPESAPIFMVGAAPSMIRKDFGYVWLIGGSAEALRPIRRRVRRESGKVIHAFHQVYPNIHTILSMQNHLHVRWLLHIGFIILGSFEKDGHHFFEMARITQCAHPQPPLPSPL